MPGFLDRRHQEIPFQRFRRFRVRRDQVSEIRKRLVTESVICL